MSNTFDSREILVLQVAQGGIFEFCKEMREFGLLADSDFITHCNYDLITPEIFCEGRPQLLITGTVTGNSDEDITIINVWRRMNSQLVVVGYSIFQSISRLPVDLVIRKMDEDDSEQVRDAIIAFRNGNLRRVA